MGFNVEYLGLRCRRRNERGDRCDSAIKCVLMAIAIGCHELSRRKPRGLQAGSGEDETPALAEFQPQAPPVSVKSHVAVMDEDNSTGQLLEIGHVVAGNHDRETAFAIKL